MLLNFMIFYYTFEDPKFQQNWIDVCPNNGNLFAIATDSWIVKIFDKRKSKIVKIYDPQSCKIR